MVGNQSSDGFVEKRRFKRCEYKIRIGLLRQGQFRFEQGVQISEGGMLVQARNKLAAGDTVEICFFVTNDDFFIVKGEVVYAFNQHGQHFAGVRFHSPSMELQEKIRAVVEHAAN